MTNMLGNAIEEMHGRSVFTLTNDAGVRMLREVQAEPREGDGKENTIRLFHRDGTVVYAEITSTSIHHPGDTDRHWVLFINDVTDKKKKEAALMFTNIIMNGIIEGSGRMVATIDLNFTFITSNSAYRDGFERVFGRTPDSGRKIDELLSHRPDELVKVRRLWARALQGEDFYTVRRFGEINDYETRFFPLRDDEGKIIGAANILYDITSLEKAVVSFQLQDIQLSKLLEQSGISTSRQKPLDSARP